MCPTWPTTNVKRDVHPALAVTIAMALVLAIGGPIIWYGVPRPNARHAQPVLDKGQTSALITYKRKCQKQTDCEDPLVCTDDPWGLDLRCLANECESDLQCKSRFMCSAPYTNVDGRSIHFCVPRGVRKEGERCDRFPLDEKWGCQPGLICNSGMCGRPCSPGRSSDCPEGFVCHPWNDMPACLPSCLQSGCPPGEQCIRMSGEFSICARVHGQDCDKQPCPPGEECRRDLGGVYQFREKVVNMWCALPCNDRKGRLCPEGFTCFNGDCARLCDEGIPGSCGAGEQCTRAFTQTETIGVCLLQ